MVSFILKFNVFLSVTPMSTRQKATFHPTVAAMNSPENSVSELCPDGTAGN